MFFLGDLGIVHCINIDEKLESYGGLLDQYATSCELVNRPQNLLTIIEKNLRLLEIEPKKHTEKKGYHHENTIDETLDKVETELSLIEAKTTSFIEPLATYSKIIRKIDLLLTSWKINRKKFAVNGENYLKESPEDILNSAEKRLSEIEFRMKEIEVVSLRAPKILIEINKLVKKLKIKSSDFPTNGIKYSIDEKFLDFIELTLKNFEEKSQSKLSKFYNSKQLIKIKLTVEKILEKIPQERKNLVKQILKLRKFAELESQSIKKSPEYVLIQSKLLSLQNLLEEVEEIKKIESHLGSIASAVYLEAWVPNKDLKKVMDGIKELTKGNCIIKDELPEPEDTVPTIIKPVPRLFEAFKSLTFSFGYPKSDEINPVFIVALTFPFLFGIMFADVGQGLLLFVAGLVLSYFRRITNTEEVGDIIRYLLMGSGLIILCGISSMIFGFFFGNFFGPTGILHPTSLATIGPFEIGGFDPIFDPVKMLRLSIFIGVGVLSLSLILRIINKIRNNQSIQTLVSVCWLWLLLGGFAMWVYWGGISNLAKWFGEGLFMFLALVILPLMIMTIASSLIKGVMEGIQFSISTLIESLDHTISFGRLAALALTHGALNYMFLILGGAPHSFTWVTILMITVGTILALTIEALIIFVHTLRLHWVEWLPGFYSGKGIPFKPIKFNNKSMEYYEYGS